MSPPTSAPAKAASTTKAAATKKASAAKKVASKAVHNHSNDPRPLAGYAVIMAGYGALSGALMLALRNKRSRLQPLNPMGLVLFALATEHLSRLITKDSITSTVRAPFTEFKEPAGEGEVNEDVVGRGLRHAVGELVTCPFCVAQWVATGLVAGSVAAPALTSAVITISATARASDYLQLLYGVLRQQADA